MTFDSSKPNSNESPSQFPAQAQTNWSRIEAIVSADHQWNDAADASDGKHNKARFPEQASAPSTAANEVALYSKEANSISELYMRRESDGNEIQMTTGAVSAAASGYSFLPGGVIIQWGKKTSPGTSGTITFPIAFPNACFSISFGMIRNASSSTQSLYVNSASAIGPTSFAYTNTSSNTDFFWTAIGN